MVKAFLKVLLFVGAPVGVGLLLGLPYLFGIGIEAELCAFQDGVQAEFPQLTLAKREYERGWFTSQVRTLYRYDTGWGKPLFVEQCDRIAHGPFTWRAGRLAAALAIIDSTSQLLVNNPERITPPRMAITTRVDWKREISSSVDMPRFEYIDEDKGFSFRFGPVKGEMVVHSKTGRCDIAGSLSQLLMEGEWGVLAIDGAGVSGDIDLTTSVAGYPCGSYSYWADGLRMVMPLEDGSQLAMECRGPAAFTSYSLENGRLESGYLYRWESLNIDGSGVGAMHWGGRMGGLNPVAHEELLALLSSSAEEVRGEEWWAEELTRLIPVLIAKRPEFEVSEFELMTPGGAITGTLRAAIDPHRVGESPASLLNGLSLETQWEIPLVLLDAGWESPTWAYPIAFLAPLLAERGEHGVLNFAFKNGFVRLHEEKLPADLFFAGFMEFVQELIEEEE